MSRAAIIGTAGHIDHGKTQLIRALTGVDTDRLKEEKKRGISIELGFTSLMLPSGRRCGVVDVPGHERFIKNMLAGAGGIDLILFVIAADEGVMPQTREHMDIIQLLGVEEGIVALTKVDLVDEEWIEMVSSDIEDFLRGTTLQGSPILPLSSQTGAGIDDLRERVDTRLAELETVQRGRFTRLPVDRVFSMEGFGTVVTGTLWGGKLVEGERIHVQPGTHEARIKAIEVHNEHVPEAGPGQRVAVCLHNTSRAQVARGDWVVPSDDLSPVQKLDVRLEAISDLKKPIPHRMRIRFYLGASEVMGRVVLLEHDELEGGDSGLAQIQLEQPIVAERGDRFVIRSFSPMYTLGGGVVIDVSEARRRRYREEDLQALRLAEEGTLEDRVLETIRGHGGLGLPEQDLTQLIGQPPAEIQAAIAILLEQSLLLRAGRTRLVARSCFEEAGAALEGAILEFEKAHRLRFGIAKSELKSRFKKTIHSDVGEGWIQEELGVERLWSRKDQLRRSGESLKLTPEMKTLRTKMLDELQTLGFSGPTQWAFLEGYPGEKNAEEMLNLILTEEGAVKLSSGIVIHGDAVAVLRSRVLEYFDTQSEMNVAALKDLVGVSRKQGVPLLEFMDQLQWTIRQGDYRTEGPKLRLGE